MNIAEYSQNKSANVKVDITIENQNFYFPKDNVGSLSTGLLKDYINIYPSLKRITIILKYFLYKKKLNNSYEGYFVFFSILFKIF